MPDTGPNPFVATSPLGDTLRNLSETIMSGPTQAQRIYQAEAALKAQQQRLGGDTLASGFLKYGTPAYDPRQQASAAIQAGVNPEHVAQTDRYLAANTKGVDDPATSASMVGAGNSFATTPQGFREATNRTLAQKTYEFDNTFETMRSPDGRLVPVARSKVASAVQNGYTVQPSIDQVKANVLTGALPGGQPPAPPPVPLQPMDPSGQPLTQPAAPQPQAPAQGVVSTDPLYNLPPSVQHLVGISTAPIPMVDARNNRYGISYDGGRSVMDQANGRLEPVAGRGWQTAGPEGAVGESRTAIVKSDAAQPTQFPPWNQGAYAQSGATASGVGPALGNHVNTLLGSVGMLGGGEAFPNVQRAKEKLGVINQSIISAFMNSPTSPIKEQGRIRDLLPTDAIFTNPTSEANKVGTLVQYLQDDNQRLRATITNPGITGPLLQQAQQALIANEKALGAMTAPAQGAPGATAAPPAAASGAPQQPQAQPPAGAPPGARQAPDGNFYVPDPSRPGKYLMVR